MNGGPAIIFAIKMSCILQDKGKVDVALDFSQKVILRNQILDVNELHLRLKIDFFFQHYLPQI